MVFLLLFYVKQESLKKVITKTTQLSKHAHSATSEGATGTKYSVPFTGRGQTIQLMC
jgi:hypothetical protein